MVTGEAPGTQVNQQIKTFPVPQQLATLTDLTSQEVQAITEAVNPLIADAFVLYTKLKNYHWHLAGSHFREYHKLFDQQAEEILESIDPLAERLRKIGGTTIRSISHVNQLQTIQDDNDDFVAVGEMVRRLTDDHHHSAQKLRAAIQVCEQNRDSATSNLLQELLDQAERRKWFLFEILQGVNNTQ